MLVLTITALSVPNTVVHVREEKQAVFIPEALSPLFPRHLSTRCRFKDALTPFVLVLNLTQFAFGIIIITASFDMAQIFPLRKLNAPAHTTHANIHKHTETIHTDTIHTDTNTDTETHTHTQSHNKSC